MDDFAHLFTSHVFYHGTSLSAAERIVQAGFRERFFDVDGEPDWSGGNLGTGIYITANWRWALSFGPVLFRVDLRPGTRVLDASEPPDPKVIKYLPREFGRGMLTAAPWRAMPRNKQLTLPELVSLFRYHYCHTWEREYLDVNGDNKWTQRREAHEKLLRTFRSILIRYGFHGYGNPGDDNGIVLFSGDRVVLKALIGELPPPVYQEEWSELFPSFQSAEEVRQVFLKQGSEQARRLAAQIASAAARNG
jgi:hypothetical protein